MSATDGPPSVPGGRSPEQREQARREREARRATEVGPPPHDNDSEPSPGLLPPVRRRRRQTRAAATPAVAARRAKSAEPGGDPIGSQPPRRRMGLRLLLALVLLLALGTAGTFAVSMLGSDAGGPEVAVEIPIGAGVSDIGDLLERRGIVSNGTLFELRATLAGRRGELRPGSYQLERDMGYGNAIDALAAGPPARRTPVIDVTIPEGRSRREISAVVRKAGLRGSYSRATVRSPELRPRRYGGRARDLEGFLFPATYEVRRSAGAADLVQKQLEAFKREFGALDLRAARRRNLTPYDVITIASMVEREAQVPRERPLIAAVIYNRLRQGIPLFIDATTRYETNNWTRPLRESVLQRDTPYNTRTNPGLPPTPIGNPGLESLRAAARPARADYIYYVVKPGTCGEHVFSESGEEFNRDVARYNAARERRGGKSPTSC